MNPRGTEGFVPNGGRGVSRLSPVRANRSVPSGACPVRTPAFGGLNALSTRADAVKKARGTLKPYRTNPNQPNLEPSVFPAPPDDLPTDEACIWAELAMVVDPMRVATAANVRCFRLLVYALANAGQAPSNRGRADRTATAIKTARAALSTSDHAGLEAKRDAAPAPVKAVPLAGFWWSARTPSGPTRRGRSPRMRRDEYGIAPSDASPRRAARGAGRVEEAEARLNMAQRQSQGRGEERGVPEEVAEKHRPRFVFTRGKRFRKAYDSLNRACA